MLSQYLSLYAEPSSRKMAEGIVHSWDSAVVIPAYHEGKRILETLEALQASAWEERQNSVVILVVNGKENDPKEIQDSNLATWEALKDLGVPISHEPELIWNNWKRLDLIVLNRFSTPFPEKQGVGLARKMGCDLACALYEAGKVRSRIVRNTDADARPGPDYLRPIEEIPGVSAYEYRFTHDVDGSPEGKALAAYEGYLHYYVAGLRKAGSPYAFHTVGSTLAIPYQSYAAVRGFPRKLAGEDFYLLNKLSKIGSIQTLPHSALHLANRPSDRVPFGTGAAQAKILKSKLENYRVFDPILFDRLKELLETTEARLAAGQEIHVSDFEADISEALDALKIESLFQTLQTERSSPRDRIRQFHTHFDALKTLRFLHLLEKKHPPVPFSETFGRI